MATLPALVANLTWESLVSPRGDLTGDHFPGELVAGVPTDKLQTRLGAYLDDARERLQPVIDAAAAATPTVIIDNVRARDAALAWGYFRAYTAVASRMAAAPASSTLEKEGSQAWSPAQLTDVQRRANEARATFDNYADGVYAQARIDTTPRRSPPRASSVTPNTFTW